MGIELAREPVTVMSSTDPFPRVTAPLNVAVPAQVSASILNDLVPSVIELMRSVKLVFTAVASAVVPLEKV
jgi:hypothetical protein